MAELPGMVERAGVVKLGSPDGLDCEPQLRSQSPWWARPGYLNSYSSFASGSMA